MIPDNTLREIHLHGKLGKMFGKLHRLAVATPREAVRALTFQFPKFREVIAAGEWYVIRGDRKTGMKLQLDSLTLGLGKAALHIVAAPRGAGKGGGAAKAVIGIALIATAIIFAPAAGASAAVAGGAEFGTSAALTSGIAWGSELALGLTVGQVALAGAAMTLAGIAALMAPTPKTQISNAVTDQKSSYIFNGPGNTATEGLTMPRVYGEVRIGSIVGAASVTVADYGDNSPEPDAPAGVKTGFEAWGRT